MGKMLDELRKKTPKYSNKSLTKEQARRYSGQLCTINKKPEILFNKYLD